MGDPIDVVDDALLVALHQLREPVAIALEDPRHEGAVVELLTFSHPVFTAPFRKGLQRSDDTLRDVIPSREDGEGSPADGAISFRMRGIPRALRRSG